MAAGVSEYIERVETDGGEVESDIYVSESVEDLGDFFDDASLVTIPTAYKQGKLYSVKPTDGSGDFTFTRSTSATRINESGLIESVAVNVPRINYLNGVPSLLLEPQRTNLFTQSNDFSGWTIVNGTLTANFATSPDGTTNASKINFTSGGELYETVTLSSGATYTLSFYAKVSSGTFDFTFGNIDNTLTSGTATTDWQRFEVTQIAASTSQDIKLDATDTGDLLIYGFQIEEGSYPTSYIPTNGATVTRIRDLFSTLTSVSTNGIINNYNTTVFLELQKVYNIVQARFITLFASGGVSNPRVLLYRSGINDLFLQYRVSGQSDVRVSYANIDYNTTNKICFTINNNTLKLFVNGALIGSATIVQGDPIEDLDLVENVNDIGYLLSKVITFPTALTDAECITLTT